MGVDAGHSTMRPAPTPIELPYSFGDPTPIPNINQNTDAWLGVRGTCDLTASEIPSVLGVGYDSPKTLWKKKCGFTVPSSDQPNFYQQEAMKRGQVLEPLARERMDILLGRRAVDGGFWKRSVTFCGLEFMLGASPDGIYAQTILSPDPRVLEIKCPISKTDCAPDSEDSRDRFWTYFFQIQTQMFCTGYRHAILFIFHPDLPHVAYRIKFDKGMWVNYVLPKVAEFIQSVKKRVEPGRVPAAVRRELRIVWAERLMDRGTIQDFPLPALQSIPSLPKRKASELQADELEDETLEAVGHFVEQSLAKRTNHQDPSDPLSLAAHVAADSATHSGC